MVLKNHIKIGLVKLTKNIFSKKKKKLFKKLRCLFSTIFQNLYNFFFKQFNWKYYLLIDSPHIFYLVFG